MEGTAPARTPDASQAIGYYRPPPLGGMLIDQCPHGIVLTYPDRPLWRHVVVTTFFAMGWCAVTAALLFVAMSFDGSIRWFWDVILVLLLWLVLLASVISGAAGVRSRLNGNSDCRLELTSSYFPKSENPNDDYTPVSAIRVVSGRLRATLRHETKLILDCEEEGETMELDWLSNRSITELNAIAQALREALHLPEAHPASTS